MNFPQNQNHPEQSLNLECFIITVLVQSVQYPFNVLKQGTDDLCTHMSAVASSEMISTKLWEIKLQKLQKVILKYLFFSLPLSSVLIVAKNTEKGAASCLHSCVKIFKKQKLNLLFLHVLCFIRNYITVLLLISREKTA